MTSLTYRLYIDGAWQESEGDAVLTVLNPATEEVIGAVPDGTAGDVNRAVDAARRAFDEGPWPNFSPRERAAVMLRMADAATSAWCLPRSTRLTASSVSITEVLISF